MSSDVLIDLGDIASPEAVTGDDADAVNTESARVYFGPLHSPEKKFASTTKLKTPVRRSTRLSSARVREHANVENQIRQPTPIRLNSAERGISSGEEDVMQDEPSVILASKVLQAHDNPSPPPSPPPDGEAQSEPHILIDLTDTDEPMSDAMPDCNTDSPVHQLGDGEANTSQPDLIFFDSFSTPSATPHTGTPLAHSSTQALSSSLPRKSTITTVDDLLSLSPLGDTTASGSAQEVTPVTADTATPTSEEEEQVLCALIDNVPPTNAPALFPEDILVRVHSPDVPITEGPATAAQGIMPSPISRPHTPVRRSQRRRSSISPARPPPATDLSALLLRAATPKHAGLSIQSNPTPSLVFPPLGVRVKKKKNSQDVSHNVEGGSLNPVEIAQLAEKRPVSPGREAKRKWEAEQPRRLGSLSPTSTGLLMQLLPNGSSSSTGEQATAAVVLPSLGANDSQQSDSAIFVGASPCPATSPPSEQMMEPKSAPLAVQDTSPEAPRTPARRIPIREAIAQGTFSPPKQSTSSLTGGSNMTGLNVGLLGTPVFRRPRQALDDPKRSPAKRVPVSQAFPPLTEAPPGKGKAPVRSASPTRPMLKDRARSNSVESVPRHPLFERSRSAEPVRPPTASSFAKPPSAGSNTPICNAGVSLPYPLIPSSSRVHYPIPEADEGEPENCITQQERVQSRSPPAASPAKYVSALRQPSANVTSRIPRIGAKPYARPKSKEPSPAPAPKPPLVPRRAMGAASGSTRPFRALQSGQGSGSSNGSSPRSGPPGASTNPFGHSISQQPTAGARVSILKRKREGEKCQASPLGAKPYVLIRKVPGVLDQPSKTETNTTPPSGTLAAELTPQASPQKPRGPIRMRKVADWKPPPREPQPSMVDTPPPTEAKERAVTPPAAGRTLPEHTLSSPTAPLSSQMSSPITPVVDQGPAVDDMQSTAPPNADPEPGFRSNGTRRSSRSRRTVTNQAIDVFGTINPAPVRPLHIRRKRLPFSDTSAFAGMTAMALRALTSSNTQKNQQQVASLKTEVIRKEGKRPGSPTTKVRTILEKQREVRVQQRHERAERRARRSSEGPQENEYQADVSIDLGDMSIITVDEDGAPVRHRRGPGDEEDYVTPPRPERPLKRERLDHEVEAKGDKGVKWDRGLVTTAWLDEIAPKPKKPASSEVAKKGCLAPTAKTLRLDNLGNVLDVNAPMPNLVREDVIVKKFVYEDDEDAQSEVPAIESVPPLEIKSKGKSKKSKS